MAEKAANFCPKFLNKVDIGLRADKSFILQLVHIPKVLFFASKEIQANKKFNQLATLFNGPESSTISDDENFIKIEPEYLSDAQRRLFIRQIALYRRCE